MQETAALRGKFRQSLQLLKTYQQRLGSEPYEIERPAAVPQEAGASRREAGEIMDAGNGPEPPDSLETSRYRSREPQVGEEAGGVGGAGTSPSTRELAMRSLRQNFPRAAAPFYYLKRQRRE